MKQVNILIFSVFMSATVIMASTSFSQQASQAVGPEAQPASTPKAAEVTQPAAPAGKSLKIINGTTWAATVSYTTPLDVKTNDTIEPNSSKTIVSKDGLVYYALTKEKTKTKDQLTSSGEGEFRVDEDMLASLLAKLTTQAPKP